MVFFFFNQYESFVFEKIIYLLRLVQNLVFYGISQNTGTIFKLFNLILSCLLKKKGSWKLNPYLSFGVSATVELFGYFLVHLILDRIGRKLPYCSFAIIFGIVAILVLPVQKFMIKGSKGLLIFLYLIKEMMKINFKKTRKKP